MGKQPDRERIKGARGDKKKTINRNRNAPTWRHTLRFKYRELCTKWSKVRFEQRIIISVTILAASIGAVVKIKQCGIGSDTLALEKRKMRAELRYEGFIPGGDPLTDVFNPQVVFKNVGTSTAKNIHGAFTAVLSERVDASPDPRQYLGSIGSMASNAERSPGQAVTFACDPGNPDCKFRWAPENPRLIGTRERHLFILALVSYEDDFGELPDVPLCLRYEPRDRRFRHCPARRRE